MTLLHRLWSRLTPRAEPQAHAPTAGDTRRDDQPPCPGCGWFDSSHELQTGLHVTEHGGDEAVSAALPLATWLELALADWQPDAELPRH